MSSLALVVAIGVTILVCNGLARRFGSAPPVPLLLAGILLGFVPALRAVHLPPEAVLLLFLPVLLYWEGFTSSIRQIRRDLRVIVLMSTVLVVLTAAGAAATAHALGVPWGPAWVLGAAIAPTDATAVGVLGRVLPRRVGTMLRAESLVNDGTALVLYALAVGVTLGAEHFSFGHLGLQFLLSYGGGVAIGIAVTWVVLQVRKRIADPFQHNLFAVITPLAAYLLAELVEVSGVLAVVASGLWVGRVSPQAFPAYARQQTRTVMSFLTTLANSALFVLTGLEAQNAVRGLNSVGLTSGVLIAAGVCAVIIGVRFGWLFTLPYVIRTVDRRPQQRDRRLGARPRTVMASAGFRGAVSMAAALSVPNTLASGEPFPDRDLIIFVTAAVIAVTLLVQAPLLPRIVRWSRMGDDHAAESERHTAEVAATEHALSELPATAERLGTDAEVAEQLRAEYDRRLHALRDGAADWQQQYTDLQLALLRDKHATIVRMHDNGDIDDEVLRSVQDHLDLEELQELRHARIRPVGPPPAGD
ncbi:Na+/H+ antiporter [Paractinoplanes toevensis]|uniref:Na(+)/H(+) exchanger n=1 Tax=Paractinoplanes toevensis TaxID=571911 RepID=A0A919T2U7_9ACTN|nr:Na+/H+ antiporter [Actinoplanes toevensis]GIM88344.1 putative Na(+)/H(+) exchanger [Actinoplanes toevensis]